MPQDIRRTRGAAQRTGRRRNRTCRLEWRDGEAAAAVGCSTDMVMMAATTTTTWLWMRGGEDEHGGGREREARDDETMSTIESAREPSRKHPRFGWRSTRRTQKHLHTKSCDALQTHSVERKLISFRSNVKKTMMMVRLCSLIADFL